MVTHDKSTARIGTDTVQVADLSRLEAFSDGVFAIAITLLTLDLALPAGSAHQPDGRSLLNAVGHLWPSYLAYVISFATILITWLNHHAIFKAIKHLDPMLVLANGFLLMVVAATAFPTRILAEHITTSAAGMASAIYAGYLTLVNVGFNALWWSIRYKRRLLIDAVDDASARTLSRIIGLGFLLYLIALVTALFSAVASLVMIIGLWCFWAYMCTFRPDIGWGKRV
jgi:uncharacterized membrane protein